MQSDPLKRRGQAAFFVKYEKNCFFINNKRLMKVIHLCQNQQLPLMREQYTFKMSFDQRKEINPLIIDNARLYIEDMVNVIRDYY